ncbi:DUF4184 family protein [Streptomyces sp. SID13031]|uniref:DUF4184 family protein n=1 Tax=Streptomyces sp. SID13031 TaxID=2706046 RepID=UPI0013C99E03|nr:DUF4184 family protein [Streptomyces sp. SID13031]NEA31455.1 DUF4184 family protein [Streptomyces sp. SID13031]
MPFTLAHPAAVLPLLRKPFVPAALVAGSMAPDVPYFLTAAGVTSTSAGDWYGPFLNATHSHGLSGLPIDLLYAVALAAVYWVMRAPISALLPSGLGLPEPERPGSPSAKGRYVLWLLVSALIGVATHVVWDALTEVDFLPSRLLQYASTAFGLVVVGWFLWKRRAQLRSADDRTRHLGATMRRVVVVLLIAAPLLGAAALAHADYNDHRTVTEVDYSRPITVAQGNGLTDTTYPETTVTAPWGTRAEGVLTGAAKRAGASFAIALLLYAAAYTSLGFRDRRRSIA